MIIRPSWEWSDSHKQSFLFIIVLSDGVCHHMNTFPLSPPTLHFIVLFCQFVCVIVMCLLFRACELTLLRPLWRLFMSMENSLSQDPTSITVLLPLHRALTELFFIAEARAVVSDSHTQTHACTFRPNLPVVLGCGFVGVCLGIWGFYFPLLCWWHCWLCGWWVYIFPFHLLLLIHISACNHLNNMNKIHMNILFNFSFFYNCLSVKMREYIFFSPHACSALSLGQSRPCHLPGCATLGPSSGEGPFLPHSFWMINEEKSTVLNMTPVRNSSSADAIQPKGARKDRI